MVEREIQLIILYVHLTHYVISLIQVSSFRNYSLDVGPYGTSSKWKHPHLLRIPELP